METKLFKSKNQGFTLLEVLLAIGITALIGVSTYTLLSQTLRTRDHLADQAENLRELQLMTAIVQNDLRQISSRIIRDQFGDYQPAIRLGGYSVYGPIEFTRNGVANPLKLPKSNFQRIAYELTDGDFKRYVWPVLDQSPDSTPREQILLENVLEMSVKVLTGDDWRSEWPEDTGAARTPETLRKLPRAIALELTTESGQVYRWLEQIPGGE